MCTDSEGRDVGECRVQGGPGTGFEPRLKGCVRQPFAGGKVFNPTGQPGEGACRAFRGEASTKARKSGPVPSVGTGKLLVLLECDKAKRRRGSELQGDKREPSKQPSPARTTQLKTHQ